MERIGIFVGVACHKPMKEHTECLSAFLQECSLKYDVECCQIYGKQLVDAENMIADRFLASQKPYLLMIEDDIWDFTLEKLEALLNANACMCGMKHHSRHYPYCVMPMDFTYEDNAKEVFGSKYLLAYWTPIKGYKTVGLSPFGFCLIRRECFDELEQPYFRLNHPESKSGNYATDSDFGQRLREIGILPIACFDYEVTHRGINSKNVEAIRLEKEGENGYWARLRQFKKHKELNSL